MAAVRLIQEANDTFTTMMYTPCLASWNDMLAGVMARRTLRALDALMCTAIRAQ